MKKLFSTQTVRWVLAVLLVLFSNVSMAQDEEGDVYDPFIDYSEFEEAGEEEGSQEGEEEVADFDSPPWRVRAPHPPGCGALSYLSP